MGNSERTPTHRFQKKAPPETHTRDAYLILFNSQISKLMLEALEIQENSHIYIYINNWLTCGNKNSSLGYSFNILNKVIRFLDLNHHLAILRVCDLFGLER